MPRHSSQRKSRGRVEGLHDDEDGECREDHDDELQLVIGAIDIVHILTSVQLAKERCRWQWQCSSSS